MPLVFIEEGMIEEAKAEFDRIAAADFTDLPRRVAWLLMMAMAARTAIALDDPERAAIAIERFSPISGAVVSYETFHFDLVDRLLGALHLTVGHLDQAATYLERAEVQSRQLGAPVFLAQTQIDLARLAMARGDESKARELADAAAAAAVRVGADALVRDAMSVIGA